MKYKLEHAELDFAVNVAMKKVHFDVWVGNPIFDAQNPIESEIESYNPMTDPPRNQPRFLYERVTYKNYKDILKIANTVEVIEPLPGLVNRVIRAVFDYARTIDLKTSQAAQLRVRIDDDEPFQGEWGSITFYVVPIEEPAS